MNNDVPERPPTVGEMILEIVEYEMNNMSWADIKTVLEAYLCERLAAIPPEALSERYDSIFNRY